MGKELRGKTWSPPTKGNSCAIACFEFSKTVHRTAKGKIGKKCNNLLNIIKESHEIHNSLNFKGKMVSINELEKVCSHYRTGCKVYECANLQFRLLKEIEGYESEIALLLHKEHYYLITDLSLLTLLQCSTCRQWKQDLKKHQETCTACDKCGRRYDKENGHTCPGKNFYKENYISPKM